MGENNDRQAAGKVYTADLPGKRDVHGQVKEWDLDPRWVTSPLEGLAHPLSDEIGRAAAGKSIDTAIPRAMLGGVANLIGIFTASDAKGRIQSGVGLAGNALDGGSKVASLATKAPTSVLAARLGAASALLGVGLTWWEAISGGGSDLWTGIQNAQRDPQFFGYYRGFATGLLGIDLPLVARDLEHPRVYDPLTLNPGWGQDKIFEAHDRAVEKGYAEAMALPLETRLAILSEAWRFKQERNVYISPRRDEVMQAIDGFARLVPLLSAEMRDGTWDVRSEQLQVQIEAEPAPDVNGLVLNEGADIRELAADVLTHAWGHAPTDAQVQDYYEQIIEANEGALPPSSDPADVQAGTIVELPPVPDEFPVSTEDDGEDAPPAKTENAEKESEGGEAGDADPAHAAAESKEAGPDGADQQSTGPDGFDDGAGGVQVDTDDDGQPDTTMGQGLATMAQPGQDVGQMGDGSSGSDAQGPFPSDSHAAGPDQIVGLTDQTMDGAGQPDPNEVQPQGASDYDPNAAMATGDGGQPVGANDYDPNDAAQMSMDTERDAIDANMSSDGWGGESIAPSDYDPNQTVGQSESSTTQDYDPNESAESQESSAESDGYEYDSTESEIDTSSDGSDQLHEQQQQQQQQEQAQKQTQQQQVDHGGGG